MPLSVIITEIKTDQLNQSEIVKPYMSMPAQKLDHPAQYTAVYLYTTVQQELKQFYIQSTVKEAMNSLNFLQAYVSKPFYSKIFHYEMWTGWYNTYRSDRDSLVWTSEHILTRGIISQITNTCGITLLRITLLHSITRTISQAKNICITIHVCHIYWK